MQNRRIVLARRPEGAAGPEHFRIESVPAPAPGPGQLLLRTRWLSLDPYMRGRMSAGPSYAAPVGVGEVMVGGTVAEVLESRADGFAPGDLVLSVAGWQELSVADPAEVTKIPLGLARPSFALGVLGMPGFTAYYGLLEIGQPQAGETVAVAASTGAVGSVVGQIARIKGCRVVGIAGGAEKCRHGAEVLGFDACVDHRAADFPERLAAACPAGIDVYFENVGGKVLEAVLPLLRDNARIPLCGVISSYNMTGADGGLSGSQLLRALLIRRVKLQGFLIGDHFGQMDAFRRDMTAWLASGEVRYAEHVAHGLESAPAAFLGMLKGENLGKTIVELDQN
jgi:NADPH-dependent curcumin reductase CurA